MKSASLLVLIFLATAFAGEVQITDKSGWVPSAKATYKNKPQTWGPAYAIDEVTSNTAKYYYHTQYEQYQWFQLDMGDTCQVTRVSIESRYDGFEYLNEYLQVRVGNNDTNDQNTTSSFVYVNDECGTSGPGGNFSVDVACATPVSGRYLSVQKVQTDDTSKRQWGFYINEINVYVQTTLLTDKSGWAASANGYFKDNKNKFKKWGPALAIDGQLTTGSKGYYHSRYEQYQWFQLDMGVAQNVARVVIQSRGDGFERLNEYLEIRVGDTDNNVANPPADDFLGTNTECGTSGPSDMTQTVTIPCDAPVSGRYLSVQKVATDNDEMRMWGFYINEIEVETAC